MLHFITANWVTIVTVLVLAFFVFLAIYKIVKDKKKGIGPCGQKCANCPHSAACHGNQ